jgi:hypothetical protein
LRQLENADYFDYVFYGHTHVREQHRTGRTLVANPGALFRANPKTCIVLDLSTGEIKPIIVPVKPASNAAPHAPSAALDDGTGSIIMPPGALPGIQTPGTLPAAPDTSPPAAPPG